MTLDPGWGLTDLPHAIGSKCVLCEMVKPDFDLIGQVIRSLSKLPITLPVHHAYYFCHASMHTCTHVWAWIDTPTLRCMHACTHACMHACTTHAMHAYVSAFMDALACAHARLLTRTHSCTNTHVHVHAHLHACTFACPQAGSHARARPASMHARVCHASTRARTHTSIHACIHAWQVLLSTAGLVNTDSLAPQVMRVVEACRMQAQELQLAEQIHLFLL